MNASCSTATTPLSDRPKPIFSTEHNSLAPKAAENAKAWDEAFVRVQSYLHAHRLQSALQLSQLTAEIMAEARALEPSAPGIPPVTLAMKVVQRRMGEWFQQNVEGSDWLDDRFRARGRLAVLMSEIVTVWPEQFLSNQPVAADAKAALQTSELQPGPEVRLSKMPPAELEFGFGDHDETPEVGRWAVHPAVGMCVVLVGAMGAAWAATH